MVVGNRKAQYLVTLAVCLMSMTTGLVLSWATVAIAKLSNNETSTVISESELSWMAALGSPGFMTGSLASRYVSDYFGRRTTILGSAIPIILGMILLVSSASVWALYILKLLGGIGVGMFVTISPIYLAEIADKEIRGAVSISSRFMSNLGNFIMMSIGPFITYDMLNYLQFVAPVVVFIICWFIPETPYFKLKAGKVDDARKILQKLRIYPSDKALEDDLNLMRSDVKQETIRSSSVKELFTGKQYRKAIIICAGLKITQMLTGSVVILYYLGPIMKTSKIRMEMSTAFIIFGAARFFAGILSSVLADRLGRRPLLIMSYLGTGISLGISAAYFLCLEVLKIDEDVLEPYGIMAYVGIILSVILSTIGFNSLIYLIPAEIFPLNVKSIAMTSLNIFGGLSNFGIVKLYQQSVEVIGLFGIFVIFTVTAFFGLVFCYLRVPETKGKSLREILIAMQGKDYDYDEAAENLNQPETKELKVNGASEGTELKELNKV